MKKPLGRRQFVAGACAVAAATTVNPAFARTLHFKKPRVLSFENVHTGEWLQVAYWANEQYIPEALTAVNQILRDYRTGDVHTINPALLDYLHEMQLGLETKKPFQVISGYRSPKTNAMLHANSDGVAAKSLHMAGKAIDVRCSGVELQYVQRLALSLSVGGVGYYPRSNFVHLDVGRARSWTGA